MQNTPPNNYYYTESGNAKAVHVVSPYTNCLSSCARKYANMWSIVNTEVIPGALVMTGCGVTTNYFNRLLYVKITYIFQRLVFHDEFE